MKNYLTFIFILCVILTSDIYPQWEISSYYRFKNEIPEHGFGLAIARNLPFQFASYGLKWRAGIDINYSSEEIMIENELKEVKFSNEEINAEVIITFFYRFIRPYLGLQTGVGHYSIKDFDRYSFLLGAVGGIKFYVTTWLHFFLEMNPKNYFTDFDRSETLKEINSFQLNGKGGVIVKF